MAPKRHPLQPIRAIIDQALTALDTSLDGLYGHSGRPSIPPECRLRARLLQIR